MCYTTRRHHPNNIYTKAATRSSIIWTRDPKSRNLRQAENASSVAANCTEFHVHRSEMLDESRRSRSIKIQRSTTRRRYSSARNTSLDRATSGVAVPRASPRFGWSWHAILLVRAFIFTMVLPFRRLEPARRTTWHYTSSATKR